MASAKTTAKVPVAPGQEEGAGAPGPANVVPLQEGAQDSEGQGAAPIYKMQDLMQAIAGNSDLKRGELRDAAGLVVAAIGDALQAGRTVSLPGLGKITPRKREEKPSGDILVARIKLPAQAAAEPEDPADGAGQGEDENP